MKPVLNVGLVREFYPDVVAKTLFRDSPCGMLNEARKRVI